MFWQTHNYDRWVSSNEHLYIGTMQHVNWNIIRIPTFHFRNKTFLRAREIANSVRQACARTKSSGRVHDALRSGRRWGDAMDDEAMRWTMRRCDGRWGDAMDDVAMLWGDAMALCYHRHIASPHRPSHRLIVHRIASSSIASPHRPSHRPIASPHRPSHRLIVHRIASSSIASPHRPSRQILIETRVWAFSAIIHTSNTHHSYKRFGMRIRAENRLRFQLIRADIDGQAEFS